MEKTDSMTYCVSLQNATSVSAAVVGNFKNTNELDMMIARVNRIEHLLVTEEGLKPHREIPVFGRIASMNSFRVPGEKLDSLLILTAKYHLAILGFYPDGTPRTRAYGHVADKVGRPAETGIITCINESGLIAMRLYEGQLKLIQWQDGRDLKNFNVRFEDYNVTDVAFLANTDRPTIAYFYQDVNGRHLKVCEVDMDTRELQPPLWQQSNIEAEATLIIPVPSPHGGLIVVGQESISYQRTSGHYTAIAPPLIQMARFNCWGRIDRSPAELYSQAPQRFLLGDLSGRLFMLLLLNEGSKEEEMRLQIELLGEISIPECLVYLDNSVAFVGSKLGDSQLIRLSTEPVESDASSFVIVIDTFPNLGPIRDLILMDVDGQNQIVTASGAFKEGSLRVIRSGIGIDEMASVELTGIKGLFPLRVGRSDLDNYLIVSFADVTHLLLIDAEEMEDSELPDFDLSKPTLWAGNLSPNRLLQITPSCVSLISGDGTFRFQWLPQTPQFSRISLAAVNPLGAQVLLSSGNRICYLRAEKDQIVPLHQLECRNEIACMDISPLGNSIVSGFFVIGFWAEHSVAVYSLREGGGVPSLVAEEKLGSEFLPRSLLMVTMEQANYLFVALGDGTVVHFRIDSENGALTDQRKFSLGTQPTSLRRFYSAKKQAVNVFACSDRPTVIYSSNHKLSFSNVNLRSVSHVCSLSSEFYRDCLALADSESLLIGTIDDIQKLHIRTIQLRETVTRLAYQQESKLIAVLTARQVDQFCANRSHPSISTTGIKQQQQQSTIAPRPTVSTSCAGGPSTSREAVQHQAANEFAGDAEVHSVCFLDANTLECINVFELNKNEEGLSITSAYLGDDPFPYFAIGTGIVVTEENECKQGRLIILQASQCDATAEGGANSGPAAGGAGVKIRMVTEKEVKGAPYSIATLGNKLVATVNSTVRLFEWTPERELRLECTNFNHIQALYSKTKGDMLLVGDLMRSICVLGYKPADSSFEEVARDYSAMWTTACEIVDSETFFAAETYFNLYCCKIDVNAESDEERMRLKQVGLYYLGEMVNVFRQGSIVSAQHRVNRDGRTNGHDPSPFSNPIIFGTGDGSIGALVQIQPHVFSFLLDLQKSIATKTHNCLRVDHSVYRSYCADKRVEQSVGFLDGDLIETVMEMPNDVLKSVIDGLVMRRSADEREEAQPVQTEDVLKLVEDLAQIR